MKKLTRLILYAALVLFVLLITVTARAQSYTDLINSNLWAGLLNLKPFTTNREAQLQIGFGKNTTTKELIEAATLTVPLSENFAAGLVAYRIGNEYALGAVNLSYGITNTMPVLGQVRSFVGDGVARNYTRKEYANFAFIGQSKDFALGKGWWIFREPRAGIGWCLANTSDREGVDVLIGAHFRSKIGKK